MDRNQELQASLREKISEKRFEEITFDEYAVFVDNNLSGAGKNVEEFVERIQELNAEGPNPVSLFLCLSAMAFEAAEAADLMKKVIFHGKPFTPEIRDKITKEIGDNLWYTQGACNTLSTSIKEVMEQNVVKLSERYPEGHFSKERAENRKE